jgi:hypothetical protein
MPAITYGTGGGTWSSEPPPILFPLLDNFVGDDQYRYIMERLAELAGYTRTDGGVLERTAPSTLFLTDILRGPSKVRDAVGLTLHGRVVDPMSRTHRSTEDQDFELTQAVRGTTIKVRCVQGRADTVRFKRGVVNDPRGKQLGQQYQQGVSLDGTSFSPKIPRRVDQWIDYQAKEADLPILDAFICLSRNGVLCRRADSVRLQERYWLFEEIRPSGVEQPQKRARA